MNISSGHLQNGKKSEFHQQLKQKVLQKVEEGGRPPKDQWGLVKKAGLLFSVWIVLYVAYLVWGGLNIFTNVSLSVAWALVMVSIQMAVMHDASHNSSSQKPWMNKLLLHSISFLGGSSSLWIAQHCQAHHAFTNVPGKDHDIDTHGVLRLCSSQRHQKLHPYQHIYAWALYPLFVLSWIWWGDLRDIINNTYGLSQKRLKEITHETIFIKIWHIGLFLVLPYVVFQDLTLVITGYLISFGLMGLIMVVVFQLAHVSIIQEFKSEQDFRNSDWALFQLASTANFAPQNRFLTWYLGGLNHQIEHHIFPYLSHTHYNEISGTVKQLCQGQNIPYHSFPTLWSAIREHQRHLYLYGQKVSPASQT